jgi:hypothetical protein
MQSRLPPHFKQPRHRAPARSVETSMTYRPMHHGMFHDLIPSRLYHCPLWLR